MSKYRSFKNTERAVAKSLKAKRTGHLGIADVQNDWLSAECKHRKELPTWMTDAMSQARTHAREGQLPVVILHKHGTKHVENLVLLTFGDFIDWFGGE